MSARFCWYCGGGFAEGKRGREIMIPGATGFEYVRVHKRCARLHEEEVADDGATARPAGDCQEWCPGSNPDDEPGCPCGARSVRR